MTAPTNKDAPAFDFYPERFWFAVEGWTDREIVAYFRLLSQQWLRDGLPESERDLKGLARGKVSARVISKFPISNDGLRRNLFLEEIREKQRSRIETCREKARKMAASRWSKEKTADATSIPASNATSIPQAMLEPCPPLTTHPVRDISIPAGRAGAGAPCTVEQARAAAEQIMRPADLGEEWFHNRARAGWTYQPKAGPEKPINAANWRSDLAAWCGSVGDSRREKVYPKHYETTQRPNGAVRPSRNDGTLNDPSEYREP